MNIAEDNIGYLLQNIATTLAYRSDSVLADQLGISYSQFKIMLVLQGSGGEQQKQIARALGQTEASISRQVKLMQVDNLVAVKINQSNRREHLVTLTNKGDKMLDKATRLLNGYHAPLFENLSEIQRRQLLDVLVIMYNRMFI